MFFAFSPELLSLSFIVHLAKRIIVSDRPYSHGPAHHMYSISSQIASQDIFSWTPAVVHSAEQRDAGADVADAVGVGGRNSLSGA